MIHLDLFSGIGGASIAVDAVFGKNNVTHIFCDNEPFAQAILKKHWPEAKIYGDIRTLTADAISQNFRRKPENVECSERQNQNRSSLSRKFGETIGGENTRIDILTGGFPCQPFSQAGRRKGTDDDRYLWPEMLRVIREFKPQWVIGENVAGLLTWDEGVVLEQVCLDLEGEGYEVQPFVIPAVAVNAPHRRDRVWIVGHATGERGTNKERGVSEGKNANNNGSFTDASDADLERRNDGSNNREERHVSADERIATQDKSERQGRERRAGEIGADASNAGQPHGTRSGKRLEANTTERSARIVSSERSSSWDENWLEVATRLCTVDDGLPDGSPRPKGWRNAALKGAGNAWVPQVAIEIMKAIKEINQ